MQPIEFEGFAADCTISGKMTMFGERLTDFLNGQERFRIHHVVCNSLADGHAAEIDSLSVERNELLCVVATGPRGNEKQRRELATARLQVSMGPYIILGRLHTSPGSDVMATVLKREPMIPLTSATIAYEQAGGIVARDVPTIIINRLQVDWLTPTSDAQTIFPDSQVRSPYTMGLVKDFTGGSM
jgi:hypothetical protein